MEDYKRGSHTVWDCKYHLVWVTKYRYEVLGGDVGQRCRELLREIASALLGAASVGARVLGLLKRKRDGRYVERAHPEPEAA
jgi:hypothetical protein